MTRRVGVLEYCLAAPMAAVAASTPFILFWQLVWRSPNARQDLVWVDLVSPCVMMDALALFALLRLGRSYGKRQRASPLSSDEPYGPMIRWPLFGFLLSCSVLLFSLPLLHLWVASLSVYFSIGGLLPYSDALGYYGGALHLLIDGELDEWNRRRPLSAMLLSVWLALCGGDLRGALLIQTAILGVCCFLMARTVAREYGAAAGWMLFTTLYAVAREHVRVTTSETLGLTLGTLASAILWSGARQGQRNVVAFGIVVMTLALNARAGAFLTLPALVAWAGWAIGSPGQRFHWRSAAIAVAAVAVGFCLNSSFLRLYGGGFDLGNGNFAQTLYGLSTGQPGWTKIYADHPDVGGLSDSAQSQFALSHALDNIRHRPLDLLQGVWKGMDRWRVGLWAYSRAILSLVPYPSYLNVVFQAWLGVGVVVWLWLSRRDRSTWLLLVAFVGFLLSGAVIFTDGGFRVLVVSYPLFFLIAALAFAPWPHRPETMLTAAPGEPVHVWPAIALSIGLILTAFIGPATAHRLEQARLVDLAPRRSEEDVLIVRLGPSTPRLEILSADSPEPSLVPIIRDADYARNVAEWPEHLAGADLSDRLHGPATVILGYNLQRDRPGIYWIIAPATLKLDRWQTVELSGRTRQAGWFSYFDVHSFSILAGP